MSSYVPTKPDVVLIGGIAVKVVYSNIHALGNVTVGHAIGKGVRMSQHISSKHPEQIQMRCAFLSSDKYYRKLALEQLHNLKIPFPFVSRLTALPFVTISSLVFTQSNQRKSVEDGKAIVDFTITLTEYKVNYFIKLGVKLAWLTYTLATYPDRATKTKLYTSIPDTNNLTAITTTEYITANTIADKSRTEFNLPTTTTEESLQKYNSINKRFSKLPFSNDSTIPQTIKVQYPPSTSYHDSFNLQKNGFQTFPTGYTGYYMRASQTAVIKNLIFLLLAKETSEGITITLVVRDDAGLELFSRKILPDIIYNIGRYQIVFNALTIDPKAINNSNPSKSITKIEGGIRPI